MPEKEGATEKIEKKRNEMLDLNKQVWSQVGKTGINKRKTALNLISIAVIVILVVFWNQITSFLAAEIHQKLGLLESQSQALVVANWLLFLLILATVGVEGIPIVRDWWNKPDLHLNSFTYRMNKLRIKDPKTGIEAPLKLFTVYANLFNDGRGEAEEPYIFAEAFPKKLSRLLPYNFGASTIDRTLTRISANVYERTNDDDLAADFIQRGTKKVEYIPGHHNGKRLLLGFAFEGGSHFYWASGADDPEPSKIKFQSEPGFATFQGLCRKRKAQMLKMNLKMELSAWDKVKFPDYLEWEIPPAEEN